MSPAPLIALYLLSFVAGVGVGIFIVIRRHRHKILKSIAGDQKFPFPISWKRNSFHTYIIIWLANKKIGISAELKKSVSRDGIYDYCAIQLDDFLHKKTGANIALLEQDWIKLQNFFQVIPSRVESLELVDRVLQTLFKQIDNFHRVKYYKPEETGHDK